MGSVLMANDGVMEHETTPIPLRRVRFDFDPETVPRHWYAGDPVLTAFWNAFSLLLPEGERFFVDSVRAYRDDITNDALGRQVAGFIAQEAMHGKGHAELNSTVAAQGYTCAPRIESELKVLLDVVRRFAPKRAQLAVTCALEHFTALLGEQLLEMPEHQAQVDERVRDLWTWHALEESEHKSVAYDVYRAVGGDYFTRVSVMLITTVVLCIVMGFAHLRLLREDRQLGALRSWGRTMNWFWGSPGLFRKLIVPYLAYFRPGFHPSENDSRALLADWTERLFGTEGRLRGRAQVMAVRAPAARVA
jgi:uncharacterized protein